MRQIGRRTALASAVLVLFVVGSAGAAFRQLPLGGQANDDAAAGIDPAKPVGTADVAGGALDATKPPVPWAIFGQSTAASQQIFSRSFANAAWSTRGHGTVNGASSASPTFAGSLNFDQTQDAQAPSIDFAGAGRSVPWASWYEPVVGLGGKEQILASRFDAVQDKWVFAGQGRGGSPSTPSLNVHANRDAENPSVAGGSTVPGGTPGPWVAWQESDGSAVGGPQQVFVAKPIGPGATSCTGVKPAAASPSAAPAGGFCWQQVGLDRINASTGAPSASGDPTLNVDPTRDAIEPDVAFAGSGDTVPWVVWYEAGGSGLGLRNGEMVFAAKATANVTADGGFQWTAVGAGGSGPGTGVLDVSGATHGFGACAETLAAEDGCSLNASPTADAVDPRVAAGTMAPGQPTSPWVVWEEMLAGHERIFVARLLSGRFQLANGGQPLPTRVGGSDATRPDISFSGNTPYVTWHEGTSVVSGHFATPDAFAIDNGAVGTSAGADLRAPIASSCVATPFDGDGGSCQGGAVGTPFFLLSDGDLLHAKLFADAYETDAPATGDASSVGLATATVSGAVNPQGAPVSVRFDYGPTTAYGSATAPQRLGPVNAPTSFAALLAGLPAGTTIHYRAVASSDFGSLAGPDRTFTTSSPSAPRGRGGDTTPPVVKLGFPRTTIAQLLATGKLTVKVTAREAGTVRIGASIAVRAKPHGRRGARRRATVVTLGSARVTFARAGSRAVSLKLTRAGRRALRHLHSAKVTIVVRATDRAGNTSTKRTTRTLRRS